MTAYSKAPWLVGVSLDTVYNWPVFRLRDLEDPDPDGAEVQADARLIQASPELLEALEQLALAVDYAVIYLEAQWERYGGGEENPLNLRFPLSQAREAIAKARKD